MGVGSDKSRQKSRSQAKGLRAQKAVTIWSVVFLCLLTFSMGLVMSPMLTQAAANEQAEVRQAISDDQVLHDAQDRVSQDQIKVYSDHMELEKQGVRFAPVGATSSMLPFMHSGAHSLEVEPESADNLKVGDVISYYEPGNDAFIIHAIIEIGEDEGGWYAITKGYNNPVEDGWKVRFDQIEGVLIGVLY